ncbi:MAG: 2,3,4,5-tetrahydropyridine-2,6-dicarboxylate N-succinyltransferase [Ignavibacteria bacterium]
MELKDKFLYLKGTELVDKNFRVFFKELLAALESGEIRVAEKKANEWQVNSWIKEAILMGFKYGNLSVQNIGEWQFFDKDTLGIRFLSVDDGIRLVPGGSVIRVGAYVAKGTVIMPPSYINIGAYVDSGCMIDSHSLVGSCAQVGKNVHLSAASQLGGVLEPVGAMPVIVEDNVFIGGNCGIYEGTIIKQNAVIATGVIINSSTPVYDAVNKRFLEKEKGKQIIIPENAVVVAGSRQLKSGGGTENNVHIYCPVIIKYRDEKTKSSITLEELLR